MSRPQFLYFDLGKVLVDFSVDRMFGQIAEVAGISHEKVEEAVFQQGLQQRFETGELSPEAFYEAFCDYTNTRPDFDALVFAGSAIFELRYEMLPLVAQLRQTGHRLGILSNTCVTHWQYCCRRYRILELFEVHALSYELHAAKPNDTIFRAAAELAQVEPDEIFFVDDTLGHVEGARAFGFDAVQYVSTPQLVADLRAREIRLNY